MSELEHEYCCNNMDYYIDPSYKKEHEIIDYKPETRGYRLILHGTDQGMYQSIQFCPWCGTKLPKDLGEEWCAIIKEQFGHEYVFKQEYEKLPKEFKTDEWWKKRGHRADIDMAGRVMTKHKGKIGRVIKASELMGIK